MKKIIKIALKWLKRELLNIKEKLLLNRARRYEEIKFRDKRRVAIYSKIQLDEEQKKAIDKLYIQNYGRKIPYTWHKHYTAFTGKFDEKYFPELLYIPEFERFMNCKEEYTKAISDKNIISMIASGIGIRTPKTILSCAAGLFRNGNYQILQKDEVKELIADVGEVFAKPTVDSGSGKGCKVYNFQGGIDSVSGEPVGNVLEELGEDFVIQERLRCHASISQIYPNSVNTFRIITYRWKKDNEDIICHMPILMRIGQGGSYLDNAHAGGMFIALDDDGTMHQKAFTEFRQEYERHPDTGVAFAGYRIDLLPEVIKTAEKAHVSIPQVGVVNWDLTIDEQGIPVLIEANMRSGSIWLPEMSHGKGAFGEHTEEVLRWIAQMKKLRLHQRESCGYGKVIKR
uniref:sugar-transfer associated ATP-grasp domain-containing protein n=1 Tax=Acetatifactor sp. TaxID=1872090 RepID=UPI004055A4C7